MQHHENAIDRSHLKRAKYSHLQDTLLDSEMSKSVTSVNRVSGLDSSKKKQHFAANLPDFSLEIPNKLTKTDLKHAKVLGQVDKKYIAIKLLHNKSLIMIDQHAADERIKLEDMLKNSTSIATLEPPIAIDLESASEFQLVASERISKYLKIWGIHITTITQQEDVTILSQSRYFNTEETSCHFEEMNSRFVNSKNRVYVTRIPKLIVERCVSNHDLLKSLIRDHVYWMAEQKDESALIKTCPKGVIEILKSKACRSIMFCH
jgi:DNA mismatch repair ATPase MutL